MNASLGRVEKPVRYTGAEWNAAVSKPDARLRFAFAYPDVYEVGMSFLGLQIIYGILNEQDWIWCERAFCPWPDREAQLRAANETLATRESGTPLRDMHIVGFSLQHEMMYTNVLTMLDLGGIPLEAANRGDNDPIVIAGGPSAYNPMPMADFIDAFVIGEGEDVVMEICERVDALRDKGASRAEILYALGRIPGIYAPSLYDIETNRLGEITRSVPNQPGIAKVVEKRLVADFENSYYPDKPVVPNTKAIHHRLALEVLRGCPGGCRFCQAGYTDRPVRERSPERLLRDARQGLKNTGFNEIGLLSLSTADHTRLPDLCSGMIQEFSSQRVSLSLPSLRIDSFPARVTQEIGKVRNTGLTFAPEAGSERLRWAVNKLIYDAEIYAKIRASVTQGQTTVKFYFMVGLPTETDDDLQGIVDMVMNVRKLLAEMGRKRTQIHVGLSPFVPKPHTAYQWYGQISREEVIRRVDYVRSRLRFRGVTVNWHDPEKSVVEGAIARGDLRVARVIRKVWDRGGRFDEWGEHFQYKLWEEAFREEGLPIAGYASKTYEENDRLPWDAVSIRVAKRYLWREWLKTFREKESRHCGNEMCRVCKVCDGDEVITVHAPEGGSAPKSRYNMEHDLAPDIIANAVAEQPAETETARRYRLKFSKTGPMAFASHHDSMMMFEEIFRRAGIRLSFSEGFTPHPKIVFAGALPVGVESFGEYMDIQTETKYEAAGLANHLNGFCPEGLRFLNAMELGNGDKKVTAAVRAFHYGAILRSDSPAGDAERLADTLSRPEIRDDLNLLQCEIVHWNGRIEMEYICAVNGGKYTKADAIVERAAPIGDLTLEIQGIVRLDMYKPGPDNRIEPLIPSTEPVLIA